MAVDSIFMMPQLGVLSEIHEKAAVEVFNNDCLVRLGTCISPTQVDADNKEVMEYCFEYDDKKIEGILEFGEIKMIKIGFKKIKTKLIMKNNSKINGLDEFSGNVYGGEVGIMLDGRGRPLDFDLFGKTFINNWSKQTNEYPQK